jgi:hypothetical protein
MTSRFGNSYSLALLLVPSILPKAESDRDSTVRKSQEHSLEPPRLIIGQHSKAFTYFSPYSVFVTTMALIYAKPCDDRIKSLSELKLRPDHI